MKNVAPGAVEKLKTASHFVVILSLTGVQYDSKYLQNLMKTVQQYPENMMDTITDQYGIFQEGGNMLTAVAMIGIDSTPIEEFQAELLDTLLGGRRFTRG